MIELGFFDLDKTTVDEKGRIYDGLEEALNTRRRSFARTILTARGYPRFNEAITDHPALTPTNIPAALENGARIINADRDRNLYYNPLTKDEQTAICDYIDSSEPFRYVSFHTQEPRTKTLLWSPDPVEAARLHEAYSHNANVFTGSNEELFQTIAQHNPCMITCRTYGEEPKDLPEDVLAYSRGSTINFMPRGSDKGTAAVMIAELEGIDLGNALAAGNDHNDIPVLTLEELGQPVVVGTDMTAKMLLHLPERALYVPNPKKLGDFIIRKVSE